MLDQLYFVLDWLFDINHTEFTLSFFHILTRALFAYIVGITLILLNRHFVAEISSFDIIIKLMIGTALAGAIVGVSPYFATIAMVSLLVFFNWVLSYISYYSDTVDRLLSGKLQVIYKDDHFQHKAMRRNFIRRDDVMRTLREKGIKDINEVELIYLERSGNMSVIEKEPFK